MKTLIVFALSAVSLFGQGALAPVPLQQPLSNSGATLIGGCLYTYATGSTTPLATYSNAILTAANTNPIVLNSSGRAPAIFLSPVSYKFVLGQRFANTCPATPGTVIWSQDPVFDAGQSLKVALALPTGAGLVGYAYATSYAAGTVGKAIQDAVNFSQSATYLAGTASKHLQQDSINPMDAPYNAACNNSADDTTAIQTAVNAAAARQVTFQFPGVGYCRITGTITISTAKTTMAGTGPHSGLAASAANFNMIEVAADDFTARDFALIGAAVDATNNTEGIFTTAGTPALRGSVSGVTFDNVNNGIKLDTGNNSWDIHDNTFRHLWGTSAGHGYGVFTGAANLNHIYQNSFYGVNLLSGRHCVYLAAGSSFNVVDHNQCIDFNSSNFPVYSANGQPASVGNVIDSNVSSITAVTVPSILQGAIWEATGTVKDNLFVNNIAISPIMTCGVAESENLGISANENTQFVNNTCSGAALGGYQIRGAKNAVIRGGSIINGSASSSGTYAAIDLAPSGNTIGHNITDGTRITGVTIYGADWRDALAIQNTIPLATNTYIAGGNNWKAGITSLIENAGAATLKRGINPVSGTATETIDSTILMPSGYVIQGASSCVAADSCTVGSTTNNNAVFSIVGDATGLGQGGKIINSAAGGDTFTYGETVAVKKLTVRGVTNSNLWHFNDLLPAAGGGGFESSGFTSIGTKFTVTGCSADTTAGGATAGSFFSRSSATCTFVITMAGATGLTAGTGWTCSADDITTGVHLPQTASTTTTCSVTGATTTGDKVQFMAISF